MNELKQNILNDLIGMEGNSKEKIKKKKKTNDQEEQNTNHKRVQYE